MGRAGYLSGTRLPISRAKRRRDDKRRTPTASPPPLFSLHLRLCHSLSKARRSSRDVVVVVVLHKEPTGGS